MSDLRHVDDIILEAQEHRGCFGLLLIRTLISQAYNCGSWTLWIEDRVFKQIALRLVDGVCMNNGKERLLTDAVMSLPSEA